MSTPEEDLASMFSERSTESFYGTPSTDQTPMMFRYEPSLDNVEAGFRYQPEGESIEQLLAGLTSSGDSGMFSMTPDKILDTGRQSVPITYEEGKPFFSATGEEATPSTLMGSTQQGGEEKGALGKVAEMAMKNPAMAAAIVNAIGAFMKKKKKTGPLPTTGQSAYNNFTTQQQKWVDNYLNKDSFDWKYNPKFKPVKLAEGGLAQLATGGTPKPSAYRTKFNQAVNKWLNTQAGADNTRLTTAQRQATQQHLWDMANNTFGDIYGASLDEFGTGKWKGGEGFANPEVLANMQNFVKNPYEMIKAVAPKFGGDDLSGAVVFDPTHNQWIQGGYKSMVNKRGQTVKQPGSWGWSDVGLPENRQFGQQLNEQLFRNFYNPAYQQSTASGDPYAVDRYTQAMNPVYGDLQKRFDALYGGREGALKADPTLASLYDNPMEFAKTAGLNLDLDEMAKRYGEGLYGRSDKTLMDLYKDPMTQYMTKYAESDPYKQHAKTLFDRYDPYTDLSFEDFSKGLQTGDGGVTDLLGQDFEELKRSQFEADQLRKKNQAYSSGYWSNEQSAYDQVPADLPTGYKTGEPHRWFVDTKGEAVNAGGNGLAVKDVPVAPPTPTMPTFPTTPAYDTNQITGYTTTPTGQQVPIYGAAQQPTGYKKGGLARLADGGNPNAMPIPAGYEMVWFGPEGNPNSYFEMKPMAPEMEEPEGGGCYVTSAVMQERGDNDDNAPELQLMRQMRDEAFAENPEEYGPKIDEYYETAPKIVKALQQSPEGKLILKEVYAQFIRPAAEAMQAGDRATAEQLYHDMLEYVAPYAATMMDEEDGEEALELGEHAAEGALGHVDGEGNGQDDQIPALLSKDEYVFDADVVAALGDGSSEAGAKKLDEMRAAIRKHKRSAPSDKIPPKAKDPMAYLKMEA